MRATELGSGVATGVKVNAPISVNAGVHDPQTKPPATVRFVLRSFILKAMFPGNTLPTSPSHEKVSFGFSKIGFVLKVNVKTFESQVTMIEDAGNVTSGAVGRGARQVPVHVKIGVNESPWALGAAKHRTKTRQSTAPIGLNRVGI